MKNKFKILGIILFTVLKSFAQTTDFKPTYSFGIKQGVNYTTVSFQPVVAQGMNLSYCGGLVFKHQNEKNFALQIELNYIQKGWVEEIGNVNNSYSRSLNYIELPLITQVVIGKRPNLKYYVNLGTSFAYLISEKENLELNDALYRREYYEKKIDNLFEYSGLGEAGITYNTGIGEFQIGIRYQLSFTDLFKSTSETVFKNSQSRLWNFSISYFFFDNKD